MKLVFQEDGIVPALNPKSSRMLYILFQPYESFPLSVVDTILVGSFMSLGVESGVTACVIW